MLTAIEGARLLEPVTDDTDAAMRARGRQRMDCAFEAVKAVRLAVLNHLKRLVVVVPAGFADCHGTTSRSLFCLEFKPSPLNRFGSVTRSQNSPGGIAKSWRPRERRQRIRQRYIVP